MSTLQDVSVQVWARAYFVRFRERYTARYRISQVDFPMMQVGGVGSTPTYLAQKVYLSKSLLRVAKVETAPANRAGETRV